MEAVQSWLGHVQDAVVNHQWWPLAALVLTGVVAAIRKLTPRIHGKLGAFLNSEHGALTLVIATSFAGAFATTFGAGEHPTWSMAWTAGKVALLSAISYPQVRKLIFGWTGIDLSSWTPAKTEEPDVQPAARTKQGGYITISAVLVLAAIGFAIALLNSGCAPTDEYVVALKVKGTASDTLYGAYKAWRVFDQVHQDDIVARATTREDALRNVASWRDSIQRKVDDQFVTAEKAVATFSDALKVTDAAKKKDWGTAISDVTAAITDLLAALKNAGVDVPSPTSSLARLYVDYDPTKFLDKPCVNLLTKDEIYKWHLQAKMIAFLDDMCQRDKYAPYCSGGF
jgi:hypothetical protein